MTKCIDNPHSYIYIYIKAGGSIAPYHQPFALSSFRRALVFL